jgi:hypothetical protein
MGVWFVSEVLLSARLRPREGKILIVLRAFCFIWPGRRIVTRFRSRGNGPKRGEYLPSPVLESAFIAALCDRLQKHRNVKR